MNTSRRIYPLAHGAMTGSRNSAGDAVQHREILVEQVESCAAKWLANCRPAVLIGYKRRAAAKSV